MFKKSFVAALSLAAGLVGSVSANESTFAVYNPIGGAANMSLTGLALSVAAPVDFQYQVPSLLGLGVLRSNMVLSATVTGATSLGPITLATFDGSFSIAYAGPTLTVGGITVTTGEKLLSGTFFDSVASFYGSTGTLQDSILAGGRVSFENNALMTFNPLADQGLAFSLTSVNPVVNVVNGQLTPFVGVSQGQFAADVTAVPEPSALAFMLIGGIVVGFAVRRGRKVSLA
jgi:hypothetical protein